MTNTEKKHWVNGYQVRGRVCHTFALSLFNYGVLISWNTRGLTAPAFKTQFKIFKLI